MRTDVNVFVVVLFRVARGGSMLRLNETRCDTAARCEAHEKRTPRVGKESGTSFVAAFTEIKHRWRDTRQRDIRSTPLEGDNFLGKS
jgi:hypothetical protein